MESLNVSIAHGVFTVSPEWRITSWNRAAEQITGFSREEAVIQATLARFDGHRVKTAGPSGSTRPPSCAR
jgi:PAS domain S-box-containing protein